jgi:hypothetical protein
MGKDWVSYVKINGEGEFKPCPFCGGEIQKNTMRVSLSPSGIALMLGVTILGMNPKPFCKKCGRVYIPQKKWFFFRGYKVIPRSIGSPTSSEAC